MTLPHSTSCTPLSLKRLLPLALSLPLATWAADVKPVATPPVAAKPAAAAPATQPADAETKVTPEVVVTATRSLIDPFAAPNVVHVLDQADLERTLTRTVPESLAELPGVMVQKTANGQGSPYIRGFTGFRTLALIDGVRFNNSIFRDGPNEYWNTIDHLSLSSLELVQGQGSVLYGSDAIGGTLNLITKGSGFETQPEGQFFMGGSTFHRYSTAEQSYVGRLETNLGVGGEWGLHVGATLKQFGDVISGGDEQPYTGYDEWSYDVRLDMKLDECWDFTFVNQLLQQDDAWRTHATQYGRSFAGTSVGDDQRRVFDHDRMLTYARLAGHDLKGFISAATLTFSYQYGEELQDRVRRNGRQELAGFDIGTYGIDLQLESDTPLGHLVYGADYYHDNVDSWRTDYQGGVPTRRIQGAVGDDSSYDLLGIFLQNEAKLSERVDLFVGGRYTFAKADVGRYEDPETGGAASYSDDWSNFVASARLSVDLDTEEHFKLYGGVSQGFRAPNLSDLSRLDIARSGELETASPGLKPEKFINYEIGLKARTGAFTGSLAYFYTDISDLIVRRPTGRVVGGSNEVSKANGGDGFVHGVELGGELQISSQWSLFGNVTWIEGEADSFGSSGAAQREPLSKIQPLTGNGGIRWTKPTGNVWVELVCTATDRADRLSSGDLGDTQRIPPGGTPGYTLLSLRSGWQINDNVTVLASLENLLDEEYRVHGSGSNEPGFGASLGVKVTF